MDESTVPFRRETNAIGVLIASGAIISSLVSFATNAAS